MGELNCWELEIAANPWEAMDRVQAGVRLDLLLLDLPQGDAEGAHILRWLRRLRPALPIILIVHLDDVHGRQESIRMGSRDTIVRPIEDRQLEAVIQRNLAPASESIEAEIASDDIEPVNSDTYFVGISPIMRRLRAQVALLAESNVPILILGEDGSGKETVARLIHKLSVRSGFEFAKVNCGALPEDLLERELFGYERNGTAAPARTKTGKLELCSRGTILLDDIAEMPLGLQSNLLQVVQNRRFARPGSSAWIDVDVRILAASPVNVERAISENRLREDLYHQLSAYTIHMPPLRDRKEELSFLSRHFMHRLAKHYGLSPRELSPAIIEAWQTHNWPGNLSELEHCVKRYLMVGDEELMFGNFRTSPDGGPREVALAKARKANIAPLPGQSGASLAGSKSLRSLVQNVKSEAERNAIAAALEKTGWNRKAAARLLKVSYRTVLYKIEHYKMSSSDSSVFPGGNGSRNATPGYRGNGRTGPAQVGK
jgi:DNA-binding NtrC family response regulator